MIDSRSLIPVEQIERAILLIRGHKVMLSNDLAALYGVEARALVQAVKRNIERFPADFMFQLTKEKFDVLEITKCDFKCGELGRGCGARPTPSPSKGWRCSPASCGALGPWP